MRINTVVVLGAVGVAVAVAMGVRGPTIAKGGVPAAATAGVQPAGAARAAVASPQAGLVASSYDRWLAQPADLPWTLQLSGTFTTVPGHDAPVVRGAAKVLRYRVQIEDGLAVDPVMFARAVHETLSDRRGWGARGEVAFERVGDGEGAQFTVTLASNNTVRNWCARDGLDTGEERVSCNVSTTDRVMINAWRWGRGSSAFGPDMAQYRRMLINHEVGHRLGHGHELCGRGGALAPVMMQQTLTLTTGDRTCRPNAWPYPAGS